MATVCPYPIHKTSAPWPTRLSVPTPGPVRSAWVANKRKLWGTFQLFFTKRLLSQRARTHFIALHETQIKQISFSGAASAGNRPRNAKYFRLFGHAQANSFCGTREQRARQSKKNYPVACPLKDLHCCQGQSLYAVHAQSSPFFLRCLWSYFLCAKKMVTITEGMVVGSDTYFTRTCPVDFRSYVVSKVLSQYLSVFYDWHSFCNGGELSLPSFLYLFSYYIYFKTTAVNSKNRKCHDILFLLILLYFPFTCSFFFLFWSRRLLLRV